MRAPCIYWIIVLFVGISNCNAQQKMSQPTPTNTKPAPLEDLVRSLTPIVQSLVPVIESLAPTLQKLGPVLDELLRVLVTPMPSGPGGQMQTPLERLLKALTAPGLLSKLTQPAVTESSVSSPLGGILNGLTSQIGGLTSQIGGNTSKAKVQPSEFVGSLLKGANTVLGATLGGKAELPTDGVGHVSGKVFRGSKGPYLKNVVSGLQVSRPSVSSHRVNQITTRFEPGKSQTLPPMRSASGSLVKRLNDLMVIKESSPSEVCEKNCFHVYQPVCTTSGNTYDNLCLQGCSGETFECAGACPCPLHTGLQVDHCACPLERNPVCTIDGLTLDNSCFAICLHKPIACPSKCPC